MSDHTIHCAPPSTPNLYGTPIFDADDGGRVAGFILERRGVLYLDRRIDEAKHRFRKYNGFGIGDAALTAAQAAGARYAKFHDPNRGSVYLADLSLFRTRGVYVNYHGHGGQWILAVKHCRTTVDRTLGSEPVFANAKTHRVGTQPAGQDAEPAATEPAAAQMALFGGAA